MNIMAYGLIKGCGYTQIKHNDFKADWKKNLASQPFHSRCSP